MIDHLPRHSYFSQAVSLDEEHAEAILKHQKAKTDAGDPPLPYAPPLVSWTPEVEVLANILDAVNALIVATINVQGGHQAPPKPTVRPRTALQGIEARMRQRHHESIVARVIVQPPAPVEEGETVE